MKGNFALGGNVALVERVSLGGNVGDGGILCVAADDEQDDT